MLSGSGREYSKVKKKALWLRSIGFIHWNNFQPICLRRYWARRNWVLQTWIGWRHPAIRSEHHMGMGMGLWHIEEDWSPCQSWKHFIHFLWIGCSWQCCWISKSSLWTDAEGIRIYFWGFCNLCTKPLPPWTLQKTMYYLASDLVSHFVFLSLCNLYFGSEDYYSYFHRSNYLILEARITVKSNKSDFVFLILFTVILKQSGFSMGVRPISCVTYWKFSFFGVSM